ncbi:hypothetical protein C8F01DRAFT_196407 [Mycena amicta]|nr:hypothetical protein C8F01DRAFT_196407 [Mycena amicta]
MERPDSELQSRQRRPSHYLRKACMNCSTRRVKCDGERPVCRKCRLQPPRTLLPCKYSYTPPHGVAVSTTLAPDPPESPSIPLLSPYASPTDHSLWDGYVSAPGLSPRLDLINIERSSELTEPLSQRFLSRFAGDHFFYIPTSDLKHDSVVRVARSLSTAIVLWATHLGADSSYPQDKLLALTVSAAARDSTAIDHNASHYQIVQLMQAHILLSLYFLDSASFMQGRYHCGVATSLALSIGLHHLGSPMYAGPVPPQFLRMRLPVVVNTMTSEEAGIFVKAFWSVVILNNYWVVVSGAPSHIPSDAIISTPWPSAMTSQHALDAGHHLTLLAKASILLERTIAFTVAATGVPRGEDFATLDHRIERFISELPLPTPTNLTLTLINLFANSAVLQLHAPHSNLLPIANAKCRAAGERVLTCLAGSRVEQRERVDVIIAPLLAVVAEVYLNLSNISRNNANGGIYRILLAMEALSPCTGGKSALVEKCQKHLKRLYQSQIGQAAHSGLAGAFTGYST